MIFSLERTEYEKEEEVSSGILRQPLEPQLVGRDRLVFSDVHCSAAQVGDVALPADRALERTHHELMTESVHGPWAAHLRHFTPTRGA